MFLVVFRNRKRAAIDAAASGLTGRPDLPELRVYASTEAHSSIEKACMTLGLGRAALVRVAVDQAFQMRPDALQAAIAEQHAIAPSVAVRKTGRRG